jgi:hypothetical protein
MLRGCLQSMEGRYPVNDYSQNGHVPVPPLGLPCGRHPSRGNPEAVPKDELTSVSFYSPHEPGGACNIMVDSIA